MARRPCNIAFISELGTPADLFILSRDVGSRGCPTRCVRDWGRLDAPDGGCPSLPYHGHEDGAGTRVLPAETRALSDPQSALL